MVDKINLQELYEFWYQITDESFDSRLQIFFNMYCYQLSSNLVKHIDQHVAKVLDLFFHFLKLAGLKMEMVESQRMK